MDRRIDQAGRDMWACRKPPGDMIGDFLLAEPGDME
jgi:hypothetical protein